MRDVVRGGTAARAMKLGRQDLAGKTGTTNDFIDAWFCGFNPSLVAVAWIGFDTPQTLGRNETGGPRRRCRCGWATWQWRCDGVPEQPLTPPAGVIAARINPETGLRVDEAGGGVPDYFYQEFLPAEQDNLVGRGNLGSRPPEEVRNQLF